MFYYNKMGNYTAANKTFFNDDNLFLHAFVDLHNDHCRI